MNVQRAGVMRSGAVPETTTTGGSDGDRRVNKADVDEQKYQDDSEEDGKEGDDLSSSDEEHDQKRIRTEENESSGSPSRVGTARREKRLAMNRASAKARRKRKKVMLDTLSAQVNDLQTVNQALTSTNESLQTRVRQLETALVQANATITALRGGGGAAAGGTSSSGASGSGSGTTVGTSHTGMPSSSTTPTTANNQEAALIRALLTGQQQQQYRRTGLETTSVSSAMNTSTTQEQQLLQLLQQRQSDLPNWQLLQALNQSTGSLGHSRLPVDQGLLMSAAALGLGGGTIPRLPQQQPTHQGGGAWNTASAASANVVSLFYI